jgi:hypothetical protein
MTDETTVIVRALESILARSSGGDDLIRDPTTTRDRSDRIDAGDAAIIVDRLNGAIPDASWTIQSVLFDTELVLCHTVVCGTHSRSYLGYEATYRRLELRAVFVARLADTNRGAECLWWCALDDGALRGALL